MLFIILKFDIPLPTIIRPLTMKNLLILTFGALIFCFPTRAQQIDYKKIILPEGITNLSVEERLVQLAWKNNPEVKAVQHDVNASQYEVKVAATRWTSLLGAQGNLNEFTVKQITGSTQTANNFYPRYNVYLNVPLSAFFEFPNQKKAARERMGIKQEQSNMLKLDIRARVLKLYSEYRKNETVWRIRKEELDDFKLRVNTIEQKFSDGAATLEEYVSAQRVYRNVQIEEATAKSDWDKSKFDLEQVIGVKLEEVL